jgi:uncharacterized protein YaaW (UPF0174 family)
MINRKVRKSKAVYKKLEAKHKKSLQEKKLVDKRNNSKFAIKNPMLNNILNEKHESKKDNSQKLLDDHTLLVNKMKGRSKYIKEQNVNSFKNELSNKDKENLLGNSIVNYSYKSLSTLSTVASSIK